MKSIHPIMAVFAVTVAVAGALVLSACGGGGGEAGAPQATATPAAADGAVPAAAGASMQSFVDYQKTMQSSETSDALSLQYFTPPADDTSLPFPIV